MENNEKLLKSFSDFMEKNNVKSPETLPQTVKEVVVDVQKIEKWSRK